ncbi:MAG: nicotinate-nucleotide diphosphorylase, partial [Algiphilus sp.]
MTMPELPTQDDIDAIAARAIAEDVGDGDPTAKLVPARSTSGKLIAREPFVLCGVPWAEAVCRQIDP